MISKFYTACVLQILTPLPVTNLIIGQYLNSSWLGIAIENIDGSGHFLAHPIINSTVSNILCMDGEHCIAFHVTLLISYFTSCLIPTITGTNKKGFPSSWHTTRKLFLLSPCSGILTGGQKSENDSHNHAIKTPNFFGKHQHTWNRTGFQSHGFRCGTSVPAPYKQSTPSVSSSHLKLLSCSLMIKPM